MLKFCTYLTAALLTLGARCAYRGLRMLGSLVRDTLVQLITQPADCLILQLAMDYSNPASFFEALKAPCFDLAFPEMVSADHDRRQAHVRDEPNKQGLLLKTAGKFGPGCLFDSR